MLTKCDLFSAHLIGSELHKLPLISSKIEILDVPDRIDEFFSSIYEPKQLDPGRQWPPRVPRVIGFEKSEYPTFSNVLLHVNGAEIQEITAGTQQGAAHLVFDAKDKDLHFAVIDGQHRINGAYFALQLLGSNNDIVPWEIPSEIFIDLDPVGAAPRHQAQIFIDVNFYQKKVDRSLVADLFPTARANRGALGDKERAQDIGRKLMLEVGPLVGIIQIPGIKFGVADVVTLATLNSAVEDVLGTMSQAGLSSLEEQTEFLAQCLEAWLTASGRKEDLALSEKLDPDNVAYQGRVLVSVITLLPACIWELKRKKIALTSEKAEATLTKWFQQLMDRAGLLKASKFIPKGEFKQKGFLGSGGIGRFRDTLWAACVGTNAITRSSPETRANLAARHREKIYSELAKPSLWKGRSKRS